MYSRTTLRSPVPGLELEPSPLGSTVVLVARVGPHVNTRRRVNTRRVESHMDVGFLGSEDLDLSSVDSHGLFSNLWILLPLFFLVHQKRLVDFKGNWLIRVYCSVETGEQGND